MTDISRLCVPRNKGGSGLRHVEHKILSEQLAFQEYVNDKHLAEPLLTAVWQSNKSNVS